MAEGGLQEIANLLVEMKGLVGSSANEAGLSQEEKDANQLQIDSILQTINRLANDTSFQGSKLLNGNFDYLTTGVNTALLDDVTINAARLADGSTLEVNITTITSAQTAEVYLSTTATYTAAGSGSITIEVTSNDGVQQFTFASGTTQASIITSINSFTAATGVSAVQASGNANRVEFRSLGYGSNAFVRVKQLEGANTNRVQATETGGTATADVKDFGRDATVTINGTSALNVAAGTETFTITGGGANFNLSPDVSLSGKVSLGIETVTTGNMGSSSIGYLSALKAGGSANVVNGNLSTAQKIIDEAVKQVASLRGRLGAFQKNIIGATINSLGISLENTAAAESSIRDTDFAAETAELTRCQIMVQAATQALAIANQQPTSVLALLG